MMAWYGRMKCMSNRGECQDSLPGLWSGRWMDGVKEKTGGQVWMQWLRDIQMDMLTKRKLENNIGNEPTFVNRQKLLCKTLSAGSQNT